MKRTISLAFVIALTLVLALAVTAMAQSDTPAPVVPSVTCPNGGFVDADGDGVCDNAPRDGSGQQFGRMGMPQNPGQGRYGSNDSSANFMDADGDGTCDNFVDANGDGVCDDCRQHRSPHGPRMGQGRQGAGMGRGMNRGMQP